jgi:hypothetical protein
MKITLSKSITYNDQKNKWENTSLNIPIVFGVILMALPFEPQVLWGTGAEVLWDERTD